MVKDAADHITRELPGLGRPAPTRLRSGMLVECDGMLCRVATVFKGGLSVELRGYTGEYVGIRSVHSLALATRVPPHD